MRKRAWAMAFVLVATLVALPAVAQAKTAASLVRDLSVSYATYKDGVGWSAQASDGAPSGGRAEETPVRGLRMSLDAVPLAGSVRYRTLMHEAGWQDWAKNGEATAWGEAGDYAEAVCVELEGLAASDYDVWYRVFVPEIGWLGWAVNGEREGTAGMGTGIEVLQVRLLPKQLKAPGSTGESFVDEELFVALGEAPSDAKVRSFGGLSLQEKTTRGIEDAIEHIHDAGVGVGFLMMDLDTYEGVAYDCDRVFYAASSIKAPYIAGVLHLHPWALERYEQQIRETLEFSWDHTYKEMVVAFDEAPLRNLMGEAGVEYPFKWFSKSNPWSPYTARDMAKLWTRIYQLFDQSPALETFGQWAEYPETSAIHGMLGEKYRTRSKAGWVKSDLRSWCATVDAGVVYADNGPYVVAIMTDAVADFSKLEELTVAIDAAHAEVEGLG